MQGNAIEHHLSACPIGSSAERIKDPTISYCEHAKSTVCLEECTVPCTAFFLFIIIILTFFLLYKFTKFMFEK